MANDSWCSVKHLNMRLNVVVASKQLTNEKKVREYLEKQIELTERALLKDISGIEQAFLTLVLGLIADSASQTTLSSVLPTDLSKNILTLKHDLVQVLDTLMKHDVLDTIPLTQPQHTAATVGMMALGTIHPTDFTRSAQALWKHFEVISKLKTLLLQCELSEHFVVEFQENGSPAFETKDYREARNEWLKQSVANKEWDAHFFGNQSNAMEHFKTEISAMVKEKYGFKLNHLLFIRNLLTLMEQNGGPKSLIVSSSPWFQYLGRFITLSIDDMLEPLKNEFPSAQKSEINALLNGIEYRKGKLPTRAPLFPIRRNGAPTFLVWTSAPGFVVAWLADIFKEGGSLGTKYGDGFEEFVRKRIECTTSLDVKPRGITVRNTSYKDIEDTFKRYGREEIQIDALAWNEETAFIISCKAHDFFFDQERYSKLLLSPYSDFYSRTMRNYQEAVEVHEWVTILTSTKEFIHCHKLEGKNFVPMLITPRRNPLQLQSVRKWFSSLKPPKLLPECEILSIADLESAYPVA